MPDAHKPYCAKVVRPRARCTCGGNNTTNQTFTITISAADRDLYLRALRALRALTPTSCADFDEIADHVVMLADAQPTGVNDFTL